MTGSRWIIVLFLVVAYCNVCTARPKADSHSGGLHKHMHDQEELRVRKRLFGILASVAVNVLGGLAGGGGGAAAAPPPPRRGPAPVYDDDRYDDYGYDDYGGY